MGTARNQDLLHGAVVHDATVTPAAITEKDDSTVLLRSAYTQASPRAGLAQPGAAGYQMAVKASGTPDEDASIELLTQKGGHPIPEDGGYVWRNLKDADKKAEYKGVDSYVSFNDWAEINLNTTANSPALNVIRLLNGDLLAAGVDTAANTTRVVPYSVSSAAWGTPVDPGVTENSTTQYALTQLPTGRVLLYWISSHRRQLNARYSDDNGATWDDYAFSVLGTQIEDSAGALVNARRMQVGYSNGQMLLLISFLDTGHGSSQNMMQYASIDEGHNFTLVDGDMWLVTGEFPADNPNIISVPSGGFTVLAHSRDPAEAVTEYKVTAYRLGTAYTPLDEADSTNLTAFFGTQLAVGFVLALTAWLDEDDTLYCLNQDGKFKGDAGVNTVYRLQLYRSLDFGATWAAYNGACSDWGVLTNNLHSFDCASTAGKALLCTRWTAVVDAAGFAEHSTASIGMGGFNSVTLPDSNFDVSQHYQEINALSWAPSTATSPTDNFGEVWFPIEIPYSSMGWNRTAGAGGTQTITANAELNVTTGGAATEGNYITHASGTLADNMVQFSIRIASGGDKTTEQIAIRLKLSDNATDGYDVSIRMDATGYEVYDHEAAANVFTAAPDLTARTWFRVAMTKGQIRIWSSPDGHARTWAAGGNGVLADNGGVSGYDNEIIWGHQAAAANTSHWSFVAYNVNPDTWSAANRLFAGGWTNPDALRAKSYSQRRTLIDDGIFASAEGGPTTIGQTFQIDADYEFALANIHPGTNPSPGKTWRSTGVGSDVHIVWDTESLYSDDGITDNNIIAIYLLNANFKDALFQVWTGAAWTTLATLDASSGYSDGATGLKFERHGRKIIPDTTELTQGERYLFYEDHVGDTFDLGAVGGGDPPGQQYAKIVHNTEGAWVGSGSTTKRPVLILDSADLDGGEVTKGTGAIWRTNFGAVIAGFTDTYSKYRLRIPAQSTADGYFELGEVIFGPVAIFGKQYDRGYAFTHLHPQTVETLPNGAQRVRKDGPEQRRFTYALSTGAVDLTTCNVDDPNPDYRTAEAKETLAVATMHDTTRTIEGLIRRTHAAETPMLLLTAIPRSTTGGSGITTTLMTQRRGAIWARTQTDPFVEAILGDELDSELERYQLITAEEVV